MGSLISPELTLDCSLSSINWVPKSTGEFLLEVSRIRNASEKISKFDDYLSRLQDEMKKIDAFKRELPLCVLLLSDAIATTKKELILCKSSITEPVMEEFIPLKETSTDEKDEKVGRNEEKDISNSRDKMDWMSSVQLWSSDNHHHHPSTDNFDNSKLKLPTLKCDSIRKRKEEVFNPRLTDDLFPGCKNLKMEKAFVPLIPVMNIGKNELSRVTELSLCTPETKNSKEGIYSNGFCSISSSSRSGSSSATNDQSNVKEQSNRKQRRCWSPELHRRFVSALQRLGGPQAATPKQIRDLMQVDGLTNDEVKSHLQKYRLHTRRVTQSTGPSSAVELGGLWASQEHCDETSKHCNSQSGSPQGPLQLNGLNGADSVDEEDDDEEKLESHSWKSHNHLSKRVDV